MMEALRSSEMSVFTRATLHNIPEDGIQELTMPVTSETVNVVATYTSETSVEIQRATQSYFTDDVSSYSPLCEPEIVLC
jgi:hypothetical protein